MLQHSGFWWVLLYINITYHCISNFCLHISHHNQTDNLHVCYVLCCFADMTWPEMTWIDIDYDSPWPTQTTTCSTSGAKPVTTTLLPPNTTGSINWYILNTINPFTPPTKHNKTDLPISSDSQRLMHWLVPKPLYEWQDPCHRTLIPFPKVSRYVITIPDLFVCVPQLCTSLPSKITQWTSAAEFSSISYLGSIFHLSRSW